MIPRLPGPPRSSGPVPAASSGATRAAAHLATLALEPVLRLAWERWPRYGAKARIPANLLGPQARQALESLLGTRVVPGRSLSLAPLDAALRASPFACGLEEALTAAFGRPEPGPAALAAATDTAFQRLRAAVGPDWPAEVWERPVVADALRREFLRARGRGPQAEAALEAAARACGIALSRLRGAPSLLQPLPVLANEVAHDPHALDAATPAGRLLLVALGARPGAGVAERQALLAEAGLAVDGVSSTVVLYGIAAPQDPAAMAAVAAGQAYVAPLRSVARWSLPKPDWAGRPVHAVENPAVFESLLDRGLPPGAALLCTSGFPSAAALVVLSALAAAGARLRYSGDFDAKGLRIAGRVLATGGGAAAPWRLTAADYRAACDVAPGRSLRAEERVSLEGLARVFPPLGACAAAILSGGSVAYQETLIAELWTDIVRGGALDVGRDRLDGGSVREGGA